MTTPQSPGGVQPMSKKMRVTPVGLGVGGALLAVLVAGLMGWAGEEAELPVVAAAARETDAGVSAAIAAGDAPRAFPAEATAPVATAPVRSGAGEVSKGQELSGRMKQALGRAARGDQAGALEDLVWCFEAGRDVRAFTGVRRTILLKALADLGKTYPPALAALRRARDEAAEEVRVAGVERAVLRDYAALNRALGEERQTLERHDRLPDGDPRKTVLAQALFETFVDARRYGEAASARPYSEMLQSLEDALQALRTSSARGAGSGRGHAVVYAAANFEALVGAGRLEEAKELAGLLLAFDSSPATRTELQERARRAGQVQWTMPEPLIGGRR